MDYLAPAKRMFPIQIWKYTSYDVLEEKVIIKIPGKKVLAEIPKSVNYSCCIADYELKFTLNGSELIVMRKFHFTHDEAPATKFQEIKDFYEKVITSDTQQLAFK
jgi:hypothetical protein